MSIICDNAIMRPADRTTITLAVQILREAVDQSGDTKADTIPVRLALRVLLPHCREKWPLSNFWDSAAQDNDIGRSQGVTAAFNGILRQLERAGWRE